MNATAPPLDRRRRVELLAVATPTDLAELAEDLLGRLGAPVVEASPEVGLIMMQVREPVCRERFQLGEVAVATARVRWHGAGGWSMRIGTDRSAALAAALCDAAAQVDAAAQRRIDELCARTAAAADRAGRQEWSALLATEVVFEELDS
ncbi:MAG: phosphonate C-P lyase system protein PhnG [Ilumatobacter fluminis]|uniref:phosphonate C-P lyase system protein PhnG n=1 Tax=Ilumatobacter fluminis TaxID=467091 RepID=UPI0032EC635C